jgi:transposase InsO family protein
MIGQQWWTAAELAEAKLPGLPGTARNVNERAGREGWQGRLARDGRPLARRRAGRGGGWEYHVALLPVRARLALEKRALAARLAEEVEADEAPAQGAVAAWAAFEAAPERHREIARMRFKAVALVYDLYAAGVSKDIAMRRVAGDLQVHRNSVYNWQKACRGLERGDWLPALLPGWKGCAKRRVEVSPEAWEAFKADFLRLEQRSAAACWRDLKATAAERGWQLPGDVLVLMARIDKTIPKPVQVYMRQGADAMRRMYPAQKRDRSGFHALQWVNVDGHTVDNMIRWPDGETGRPVLIVVQDLYSNKILGWRIDKSESAAAVRLALYDTFRDWGIPDFAVLDNGRAFASKQLTGGQKSRYRFKVTQDEMRGSLTALGVEVHWTLPYSGQSKPIERVFRDFTDAVSRGAALAGSYTGNSPENKPDYPGGPQAAPLEVLVAQVAAWVQEQNARPGRRTDVAQGRSFDEVFAESYRVNPITRPTEAQLRMAMLAAEQAVARKPDGALHLYGNRYWAPFLGNHISQRLTVRLDPDALLEPVEVYTPTGEHLGSAECWAAVGFDSTEAAREHARKRRDYQRHVRAAAEIERSLSAEELAALQARAAAPPPPPEARVVRMMPRRGSAAAKPREAEDAPSGMSQAEVLRLVTEALDRRDAD